MAYRGGGLTPFGGLGSLFSLRRDIDRLFDDTFTSGGGGASRGGQREFWNPAVNVREGERELSIDVELPGVDPSSVELNVENGVLTISGEKREERKEGEEGRYHLVERRYGSFMRSFQLPPGVKEENITADYHNGVLTIHIPRAALPQPRKIQIGGTGERAQQIGEAPRAKAGETRGAGSETSRATSRTGAGEARPGTDKARVAASGPAKE